MKIKLLLGITLIFFCIELVAQKNKNPLDFKHDFNIYYTSALTKTNLDRENLGSSGWFKDLARLENETNPVFCFNLGFQYRRKVSEKLLLGIGLGYEEKGEISKPIYIEQPTKPNSENIRTIYKFNLKSYQVPIELNYLGSRIELFNNRAYWFLGGQLILDVYGKYSAQTYIKFTDTGEFRKGGVTEALSYYNSPFQGFYNNLIDGFTRLGIGLNAGIHHNLTELIYLEYSLRSNYYTGLFKNSPLVISGDAFLFGLNIKSGIRF